MAYETYKSPTPKPKTDGDSSEKLPIEQLTQWKARIAVAVEYQKKHGNVPTGSSTQLGRWDVNVRAIDGDFNSREELGEEAIDVNVTSSTLDTLLSPMWTNTPHITVEPRVAFAMDGDQEFDNRLHADATEIEINYWLNELKVRHVVKKCIIDCAATNQGFSYVGYIAEKSDIENEDGQATENEPQIRLKQPFVKRLPPKRVLMPAGYYDLEECPWIALGFERYVKDVQDKYGVTDLKADSTLQGIDKLEGVENLTPEGREYLESDEAGCVTVWQIWDKRDKKMITLTMGHEHCLEYEDWPWDVEGFPVDKLRFHLTPDQQFGMPLMTAWMAQQKELNAARTATRRREARTKTTVWLNNMPEGVEDAYKKAADGGIINLKDSDTDDIRKTLMIDPGLPPAESAYNYGSVSLQDLLMISGLGLQQRGAGDPNINSATASALVDKWAQIRQTNLGDIVREFWISIAKKIWMILKEFPNVKRDMLVVGKTGQIQRISYTLAELKGDFNFTIDIGSMYQQDPATRRQNAYARYNLLRADPLIRGEKLIADLLKADNVHDRESYFTKLLSPQEEFMKMLQGLPVEPSDLDDHASHMQAHEQQAMQLEQVIATSQAGSPQEMQARSALLLLIAHVNATSRILAMIDSKNTPPGDPMAQNMMQAEMAPPSGETAAEMAGQPAGATGQTETPAGIEVA